MAFRLSQRSRDRLTGVHPDLVAVIEEAIKVTHIDFTVLEGVRSMERQKQLKAQGASQTLNSRHLTGHAVDIAPWVDGTVSWHWPHYHALAPTVKTVAEDLGVPIEWGGNWQSFKDGPHWQLPWDLYPKDASHPVRFAKRKAAAPETSPKPPEKPAPAMDPALEAAIRRIVREELSNA